MAKKAALASQRSSLRLGMLPRHDVSTSSGRDHPAINMLGQQGGSPPEKTRTAEALRQLGT